MPPTYHADPQTRALQLALQAVCLRLNLCSGNPIAIEHHMSEAMLSLMHLLKHDPTIGHCLAALDPYSGHPGNDADFDSADVKVVQRLLETNKQEILALASPGTGSAAAPPVALPAYRRSRRGAAPSGTE